MRLQPAPATPFAAPSTPERPRDGQQRRPHVKSMLLRERTHFDHRPVLALIAGQPQPLAQPLDHREVGLPPGVDLGLGMPSHHPRMDCVARPGKPLGMVVGDRITALHLGYDQVHPMPGRGVGLREPPGSAVVENQAEWV